MKLAERLSEPKVSCSLPISAFSIVPNFLVLLASWSGAEASRTHDLNTSSTSPLHCFRPMCSPPDSPHKSRFIQLSPAPPASVYFSIFILSLCIRKIFSARYSPMPKCFSDPSQFWLPVKNNSHTRGRSSSGIFFSCILDHAFIFFYINLYLSFIAVVVDCICNKI